MHGEVLSSLWLATPTWFTATLMCQHADVLWYTSHGYLPRQRLVQRDNNAAVDQSALEAGTLRRNATCSQSPDNWLNEIQAGRMQNGVCVCSIRINQFDAACGCRFQCSITRQQWKDKLHLIFRRISVQMLFKVATIRRATSCPSAADMPFFEKFD